MFTFLRYFQAITSVLLILAILVQSRSSGLSSTFGGNDTFHVTKRGAEKVIFQATIVLSVLFVLSSLAFLFVR